MAIIECPYCGKPVSDRGKDCVYCGNSLNEPPVECPRCGNKQSKDSESCRMCGCPLNVEFITCPECEYSMPAGSERCENCGCPLAETAPKQFVKESKQLVTELTPPAVNDNGTTCKKAKKYMVLSDVCLFFAGSFVLRAVAWFLWIFSGGASSPLYPIVRMIHLIFGFGDGYWYDLPIKSLFFLALGNVISVGLFVCLRIKVNKLRRK